MNKYILIHYLKFYRLYYIMNYLYYINNNLTRELYQYEFFSILSLSITQEYNNIIIFCKNIIKGKFYEYLNKNITINFKIFKNEMNIEYIINLLKISNISGIYIKNNVIFFNKIDKILENDYFNISDNFIYIKNNMFSKNEYNYENYNIKIIDSFDDIMNNIYDYNYETYFNYIKYDLICINNNIQKSHVDFNNKQINILKLFYINIISKLKINDKNGNFNLINNIDMIYWINLEKSKNRKNNMIKILDNINITNKRIDAIDGSIIENIKDKYFFGDVISNNSNKEYSTILSHLNAIEEYKSLEYIKFGVSIICEDDLSLDFFKYWEYNLENIIKDAPNDWEIIMLSYFTLDIKFKNNYRKWDNDWSAACYLIKHSCLNKLDDIKNNKKYKSFEDVMVADNYLFRIFNTYLYKNPYFTFPEENNSTIHDYHLEYHKLYKNINKIILNKNITEIII